MTKLLACVDGSVYAESVADHAAWAAEKLGAHIEFLQVLGRRDASADDLSGRIVAGARRKLLEQLAELDAERAKLAMAEARIGLDEAIERMAARKIDASGVLRHGDLLETISEREETAELVVLGKRGEAADFAKLHLGSNLERILRGSTRPILVSARAFRPIKRVLIAFDGGASAQEAVKAAASSPLFSDLEIVVFCAGDPSTSLVASAEAAVNSITLAGRNGSLETATGAPGAAIPDAVSRLQIDIILMGAYGHSLLRRMMIGSTTAEVIRESLRPILVYR